MGRTRKRSLDDTASSSKRQKFDLEVPRTKLTGFIQTLQTGEDVRSFETAIKEIELLKSLTLKEEVTLDEVEPQPPKIKFEESPTRPMRKARLGAPNWGQIYSLPRKKPVKKPKIDHVTEEEKTIQALKSLPAFIPSTLAIGKSERKIEAQLPADNFKKPQESDLVNQVQHEQKVMHRIAELRKAGLWTTKKLPKVALPVRQKNNWDFMLEEVEWMARDFRAESRLHRQLAKKASLAVKKYFREKEQEKEKLIKEAEMEKRRKAQAVAKIVKDFWKKMRTIGEHLLQKKIDSEEAKEHNTTMSIWLDSMPGNETKKQEFDIDPNLRELISTLPMEYLRERVEQGMLPKECLIIREQEDKGASQSVKDPIDWVKEAGNYTPEDPLGLTPLIHGKLRPYQIDGVKWLIQKGDEGHNVILADEMGLGKTIQTISLFGYLALYRMNWGPHLIIVPTSVLLNWEVEIARWLPGFEAISYYGTPKERKIKRTGWTGANNFNVCVTSYNYLLQDLMIFRRMKWKYVILDEAQAIKNSQSQRWEAVSCLNTERKILLTGTPLQNNLDELFNLMQFLHPEIFHNKNLFNLVFEDTKKKLLAGGELGKKMRTTFHEMLGKYMIRRLKKDVAQEMPQKFETTKMVRLARRQRRYYEEYINANSTRSALQSGSYMSVIQILMQLRKVCNHPDLFDVRPVVSPYSFGTPPSADYSYLSFDRMYKIFKLLADHKKKQITDCVSNDILQIFTDTKPISVSSLSCSRFSDPPVKELKSLKLNMDHINLEAIKPNNRNYGTKFASFERSLSRIERLGLCSTRNAVIENNNENLSSSNKENRDESSNVSSPAFETFMKEAEEKRAHLYSAFDGANERRTTIESEIIKPLILCRNAVILKKKPRIIIPVVGGFLQEGEDAMFLRYLDNVIDNREFEKPLNGPEEKLSPCMRFPLQTTSDNILELKSFSDNFSGDNLDWALENLVMYVHPAHTIIRKHVPDVFECSGFSFNSQTELFKSSFSKSSSALGKKVSDIAIKNMLRFPESRLIQYDCGKLQYLDKLLHELRLQGHRALIFTQMTKMLDILEKFLTYHGFKYLRLDGSTKIDLRQKMMDRFNNDSRIFCFILSTRSGGLGINLTGADTVIFYDSDWNPTMDTQAQDRCHRIGQTRDVTIYRLVSKNTVEVNIKKKADEKREICRLAIDAGDYRPKVFTKGDLFDIMDEKLSGDDEGEVKAEDFLNAEEADDRKAQEKLLRECRVDFDDTDEKEEKDEPLAIAADKKKEYDEVKLAVESTLKPVQIKCLEYVERENEEIKKERMGQIKLKSETMRRELRAAQDEKKIPCVPRVQEVGPKIEEIHEEDLSLPDNANVHLKVRNKGVNKSSVDYQKGGKIGKKGRGNFSKTANRAVSRATNLESNSKISDNVPKVSARDSASKVKHLDVPSSVVSGKKLHWKTRERLEREALAASKQKKRENEKQLSGKKPPSNKKVLPSKSGEKKLQSSPVSNRRLCLRKPAATRSVKLPQTTEQQASKPKTKLFVPSRKKAAPSKKAD